MQAQTKIIAHRGFSAAAPENTLIAFQKAIDIGADYIELDARKTKDNQVVVIHDAKVNRTSSKAENGEISSMTYDELLKVWVGYPTKFGDQFINEHIPTLKQVLTLAKGRIKVCIEIKVEGIEKEVLDIVDQIGMANQVIIFSFSKNVLIKIREMNQHIPCLYLVNTAGVATINEAKSLKFNAIGIGTATLIGKRFIDMAHQNNTSVWQWTVNNEKEMGRLIGIGLDGLITNHPDKALKQKEKLIQIN